MAAKSPITALAEMLSEYPSLKENRVPVYPGRKSQAKSTAARRIVLYPHKSGPVPGVSQPESLTDIKQVMVADCWGRDIDETWALMAWLIEALQAQSIGSDAVGNEGDADYQPADPGYYWSLLGADWDIDADTSTQGETVSVLFEIQLAISSVPYDAGHMGNWPRGRVDSVSQDQPAARETT